MRTGLSTILQTLTPEAATILNHSIAEAGRRNHNQTTPLHVGATLLAAPAGFLRQACIRSHPNSSHPLQCRPLELCFSVALDRLPSAITSPAVTEPPVSNALMAALKRAQAHQRRGCPEQQQQPLLAIKVELEQLIISILDDPSVSRVMREASFSSPAVKATIEQSLNNNNNNVSGESHLNRIGFRPSPVPINRNLYLNPRLQQEPAVSSPSPMNLYLNPRLQQQNPSNLSLNQSLHDDVKRVIEIMSKSKKKNPILVGEFDPESVKKEILTRIQNGELGTETELKNAEVIPIGKEFESPPEKSQIPAKIKELSDLIESRIQTNKSVIIDLADLKWLVEQPPTSAVSEFGRKIVSEMAKLVAKFLPENNKVWLIGTATCETYLRCQVYHPSMENDWDLQAVPISSRSSFSSRIGTNGILGSSVESLTSFKNFPTIQRRLSENSDPAGMPPCCPKCYRDYEQEVAKLNEPIEVKSNLPLWLQNAKSQSGELETESKSTDRSRVNARELQKKWSDICSRTHPNHNENLRLARMAMGSALVKPNGLLGQSQIGRSQVRTELVLGPEIHEDLTVKDLLGCISSEPQAKVEEFQKGKFVNSAKADLFKKLLKGLMKKAWWQPEAASAIATAVTRFGSRGPVWLLFAGPDRIGKKKMAAVLADHVSGSDSITVSLGSRRDEDETNLGFRGKTVLDRVTDAVRQNPGSVIVLSDIDEADMVIYGSIKRAMERGRLTDSHGREISLRNVIFVLTGNWSTNNIDEHILDEKRLHSAASSDWRLKLIVNEKQSKRKVNWPTEGNNSPKQHKRPGCGISLDLNLAIDAEEDRTDTSDLTIDQEDENRHFRVTSVPHELVGQSDGVVVFKPVRFGLIRREIEKTFKNAFYTVVDKKVSIEVDEVALENILGGIWFGPTSLEEWAERVLVPSFHELAKQFPSLGRDMVVRLESNTGSKTVRHDEDWLPREISITVD